jgi:peptidoglycan/xylan/chitin deacetylase (PgdA/CDA1 family)
MQRPRIYGLMYHDVVGTGGESGRVGDGPDRYKLSWPAFVAHLDAIEVAVAAAPVVVDDAFAARPSSGWSLTFDDGGSSALAVAEELCRRAWRGHFFVTTDLMGQPGFVDADAVRELGRMGHAVGSHSVSHPASMSLLPQSELLREWAESIQVLGEALGKPVRIGSVPGGHYRRNIARAAASAGIRVLFTSEPVRRARNVGGCLVVGRYAVRRHTSSADAAAVAAGRTAPWLRQRAGWSLRKPAKLLAGRQYDRVRRSLLSRSDPPPTTDA